MAKVKNKRNAGLADRVHNKKRAEANKKKLNPFEVHINKEKLKVLGKKSKHDRGLPGVSRAKAIQKRKETLGTEMKLINKTNTFIDRRIGEKNNQISAEDRMIARFAAERAKQHSKKSIYNLADDEVLTHRGQTLEQIEKFDDPRSSDDEDEGAKFGGLGDDFVSEGHFGGGVLSKSDSKDGAKSHKDLIEQLIAESKKRKAEKQKEKEQTLDLTEKLDSEWKDLQPVVFKKQKVEEESLIDKLLSKQEKGQDYDKMMRELRFEKRGTPSDGLKNQEKQDEEERKKIEELERQRELRMLSEEEQIAPKNKLPAKHRSADDLDDNFELDTEQNFMLAYDKDGKPLVSEHVLKDFSVPNSKKTFEDGVSDTSDDESENESGEESEGDEGESEENNEVNNTKDSDSDEDSSEDTEEIKSNKKEVPKGKSVKEDKHESDSDEDDEGDESDESDQSDSNKQKFQKVTEKVTNDIKESKNLKRKHISEPEVKVKPKIDKQEKQIQHKSKDDTKLNDSKIDKALTDESSDDESEVSEDKPDDESEVSEDKPNDVPNVDDLNDLKGSDGSDDEVEDASEMIGSFFEFKSAEGDNLKELLNGKTPVQQSSALKKLITSYDPSLSQDNKEKLSRLFAHLLQYIHDIFTNLTNEGDITKSVLIFDRLVPYLYDLVHLNKVSTKKFMVELLKEKYDSFKRNPKKVPDLNTIMFFKLVSILYPTSDFRHPVTTPSLIFMNDILTLARYKDAYSLSRGFFIMSLVLEYTVLSKRLVPAALNFLRGVLYLCTDKTESNHFQVVPPFRSKNERILHLTLPCTETVGKKMMAKDLVTSEIDASFKIRCLSTAAEMLKELFDNYIELETLRAIFEPHVNILNHIDLNFYPKRVCNRVEEIYKYMREMLEVKTYRQMCREKERPKALRLYEPDIQEVFTGSKNSKLSKENAEKLRLKGKYKKEMKGALREIRRDKAYIASVKIRQKIQSDNIRKDKVKQIYKDASIQQGELNKLKRMK